MRFGIRWQIYEPYYGIRWQMRPLMAKLRHRRKPIPISNLRCQGYEMIILFHPRATKPRNCRLPLAVLALAAVLEGREEYRIIDGNLEDDPTAAIIGTIDVHQVELLGVSCMPGPQMVAAMETCREIRRLRPYVRIVWGGYFPSLYPDTALNAKYVDYVVRGQGEDTLLELIDALRGKRALESILGLCYKGRLRLSSH